MVGTKEFFELMDIFEKTSRDLFYGHIVEQESKETVKNSKVFYTDGFVNSMFMAFMCGYQYHKSVSNQ